MSRVLVTAKAPQAGLAKTRLCPPLGLELAARLAQAFLEDALAHAREADPDAGLLAPADQAEELRATFPDTEVIAQHGVGLAAALEGAVRDGHVLVSGDAPTYPAELTRRGLESPADLVLGPSLDGGYCLIAMRRFHPAPFRGIAWSTGEVLAQTRAAGEAAGLTVELLDPHPDVDTYDDLARLSLDAAPATAAVLADPAAAPFAPRPPRVVSGRTVAFASAWRELHVDSLAGGQSYSYLEIPPAVWIVPVDEAGDTVLVRQYRHPVRAHPLETPAGSIQPGEDPVAAAARELREEVGGVAEQLTRIGGFYSSSAHISLRGLVFLAAGVRFSHPTHAADEGIELVRMPLRAAADLAERGELCEAQSALALIWAARALRQAT